MHPDADGHDPTPTAPRAHGLEGVTFGYRGRPVLHDLTWSVPPGITALMGPNGAGKTTLLRLCAGELEPRQGRVLRPGGDPGLVSSGHPRLPVLLATLGGWAAALLGTTLVQPLAPEWERPVTGRVRRWHLATWAVVMLLAATGPLLAAWRLRVHEQVHPGSILVLQAVGTGVAGLLVGRWSAVTTGVVFVTLLGGLVAVEQALGVRRPLPDPVTAGSWVLPVVVLAAGTWAVHRRAGQPRLRGRAAR